MRTLASFLAVLCLLATACTSPQKTAYTSLSVVGMSVDKAMQAAADATVAGKVSAEDWQRIAAAHAKFIPAYRTACELAKQDYTKATPETLLLLQSEVLTTINTILTKP